jgi:hypothetical protein
VRLIEEVYSRDKSQKRLKIITVGTDKYMFIRQTRTGKSKDKGNSMFEIARYEQFNERVLAMDITNDSGYVLTVHDRFIQL